MEPSTPVMPEKNSEVQRVLAALKESESRLNAIIETAVDGIITIDRKGTIQTINSSALALFQYAEEEVLGKNVSVLMPEPHSSGHDKYIENYQTTGERKIIGIGRQVSGKKKDGSLFPFRLSISEVKLEGGTIYTGIVHDLSEQVKAEQGLLALNRSLEEKVSERTAELNVTNQELNLTNQALQEEVTRRTSTEKEMKELLEKEIELGTLKSRFVSMASHEFRTPLSGILSSATLIAKYKSGDKDAMRQKHIDRIKTSVHNLTSILNDFLSLDKLQSGDVSGNLSDFAMEELLQEVCDEVRNILHDDQHLECLHDGTDVQVRMDRNILKNVMLNLLSNAIKYSQPAGRIEVHTSVANGMLKIEVKDNGIGIPEGDQKHMFQRFFRAQNAVNIKGTGLGLNIVKRYLELMKGEISFSSKEGVGTTFIVTAPIQPPQ